MGVQTFGEKNKTKQNHSHLCDVNVKLQPAAGFQPVLISNPTDYSLHDEIINAGKVTQGKPTRAPWEIQMDTLITIKH